MRPLTGLAFENSFARLHPAFYEVVEPTPLPDPRLIAFNPDAAALIDLDPASAAQPEAAEWLSGGKRLPGAEPIAQAYAGHQFGVWVPQLGDGRAFLLGEARNARGESWDLHLKGGGRTRFSRHGDGRSVLRSAIREYLGSEALFGLGIPTTRALCIVASNLPVERETVETAASIIRLAPSHVRFGTFEYFAARGEDTRVRELADYVIGRHFGQGDTRLAPDDPGRYAGFFGEVCRRTARLMAHWMAAGFAHGVMNTDNMSALGITLDFGPYGFLDDYDPGFVCNHTDTGGQYAFDRQPSVGMWNCARFGETLLSLIGLEEAQRELETYWPAFAAEYARLMRSRLGLRTGEESDAALLRDLFGLLQAGRVDYPSFFRELACDANVAALFPERDGIGSWLTRYSERVRRDGMPETERRAWMLRTNPRYILRNWVAEEAIAAARDGGYELIEALRRVLAAPCEEHPGMERFAAPPAGAARDITVSCSS
ncbi:MAG TPA: YdiU family protein [Gemmatimonadales bacterium]